MTRKGWKNLLASGVALCLLSSATAYGQQTTPKPAPLDVMLLIDNSPSNARTDPKNLRISAAKFLLDYLELSSQVIGVNCRAGVANFGGKLGDVVPLRPVQGGEIIKALRPEKIQFTDFRPPLDYALKEFKARSFGVGNNMAVILFTDGTPELSGKLLAADEKMRYFKGEHTTDDKLPPVNRLIADLQEASVKLFVVAIGDSKEDADLWKTLIPADHYRSISSTTNLAEVFHSLVTDLIGVLAADKVDLRPDHPQTFTLSPHLEQAIFSFIKERPDVTITLTDPTGKMQKSSTSGRAQDFHEVYVITNPAEGNWQVSVANGRAQMFMDKRLPRLELMMPTEPIGVGKKVLLNARLLCNQETIVNSALHLSAKIKSLADGWTYEAAFVKTAEGLYALELKDLSQSGEYMITAEARLAGQPLEVDGGKANFTVLDDAEMPPSAQPALWESNKALLQAGFIILLILFISAVPIWKLRESVKQLEAERQSQFDHATGSFASNNTWEKKLDDLAQKNPEEAEKQFLQTYEDEVRHAHRAFFTIVSEKKEKIKAMIVWALNFWSEREVDYKSLVKQRNFIYAQASKEALDVQLKALAPVLLKRWVELPDNMIDEFYELLCQPKGIEVLNELSQVEVPEGWIKEKTDRAAHLKAIAHAAYQMKE
jgi:hypothetical protein